MLYSRSIGIVMFVVGYNCYIRGLLECYIRGLLEMLYLRSVRHIIFEVCRHCCLWSVRNVIFEVC